MVVAIVVLDAMKAGISNCKPSKGATPSTLKHAGQAGLVQSVAGSHGGALTWSTANDHFSDV